MAYNNQYPGYQAPAPAGQTVTAQKNSATTSDGRCDQGGVSC